MGSKWNKDFGIVCSWKDDIVQKNFVNIADFCWWFSILNCLDTSKPKYVDTPSDQNMLIVLLSNIYNGNIARFWHKKLCMKIWYSSKSLWILLICLVYFFLAQNVLIPSTHILLTQIKIVTFLQLKGLI